MNNKEKINMGFWSKLSWPIFCLAPMLDVTDHSFRQMFVKYSKNKTSFFTSQGKNYQPVFFTEFVSADGLASPEGRKKILSMLKFKKNERPIVAQIFGSKPENMKYATRLVRQLGFDGIDINMGCPDRAVVKTGAGAALIKNPKLAMEIIYAVKDGAGKLPVSVKTRLGFTKNEIETWIPTLLSTNIAAITLHGRTQKEMSTPPADWAQIGRMMEIIRDSGKETLGMGNGDISSIQDARDKAEKYKCDGVMVGRGAFGKPWFFNEKFDTGTLVPKFKLRLLKEHIKLFQKLSKHKNNAVMKKHFKAYISGFDGAKDLRMKLMNVSNLVEVLRQINKVLKK